MYFTSTVFLVFLAVTVILYYVIPKKLQWPFLLLASLTFYAFSGWQNAAFIVLTIVTVFVTGRKLSNLHKEQETFIAVGGEALTKENRKAYKASMLRRRRKWLVVCLAVNLGVLLLLKNVAILSKGINAAFSMTEGGFSFFGLLMPLGISFYTFQAVSYIIDVYRGKTAAETNLFRFAQFVSFFPQIIQGPISRFDDLKQTLFTPHPFSGKDFSFGLQRVLWGFFKKLVIADRLIIAVKAITGNPDEYHGVYVLLGMLFYAITLYCDFTGGIDITIGIAEMLGIRLKENFNRPFSSKSITEYWRRWHITMGTWFRDYLFYPLSVSKPMLKLATKSRKVLGESFGRRVPVYISTLLVWFATGFWHGSSANFIVWGLANGIVILISEELTPFYKWFNAKFGFTKAMPYQLFQVFRTFWLMCFIRTFDTYASVKTTFAMFGTLVTDFSLNKLMSEGVSKLGLDYKDYAVVLAGICLIYFISLLQKKGSPREMLRARPQVVRHVVFVSLFIVIIVFGIYGIGYEANQFIYNQF